MVCALRYGANSFIKLFTSRPFFARLWYTDQYMVLTHIPSCLLQGPSLLDYGIRTNIINGANSYTKLFTSRPFFARLWYTDQYMALTHIPSCLLQGPPLLDFGIRTKIWCQLIYQVVYFMALPCSTMVYAPRYGANS